MAMQPQQPMTPRPTVMGSSKNEFASALIISDTQVNFVLTNTTSANPQTLCEFLPGTCSLVLTHLVYIYIYIYKVSLPTESFLLEQAGQMRSWLLPWIVSWRRFVRFVWAKEAAASMQCIATWIVAMWMAPPFWHSGIVILV